MRAQVVLQELQVAEVARAVVQGRTEPEGVGLVVVAPVARMVVVELAAQPQGHRQVQEALAQSASFGPATLDSSRQPAQAMFN